MGDKASAFFGKYLNKNSKIDFVGAPEGNNLEPFSAPELLEELECWTEILKSEPEVIHRLKAFAEAAEGDDDLDGEVSFDLSAPEVSP